MQALPGYHTAVLTRQENKTRRNLRRLCGTTHGRRAQLVLSLFRHSGRDQRRPHGPRADGVDADTVSDLLVVQAAREGYDGAFGGGVVEQIGAADVGVYGGAVDDCVAALHVFEAVFREVEVGVDVDVECSQPLLSVVGCVSMIVCHVEDWERGKLWTYSESSLIEGNMF